MTFGNRKQFYGGGGGVGWLRVRTHRKQTHKMRERDNHVQAYENGTESTIENKNSSRVSRVEYVASRLRKPRREGVNLLKELRSSPRPTRPVVHPTTRVTTLWLAVSTCTRSNCVRV